MAFYVSLEDQIYFYDPRGFQEMAMGVSQALRGGPLAFIHELLAASRSEYPPYWSVPLTGLSPARLNVRIVYILAMTIVGLVPVVILITKIVSRLFSVRVSIPIVLIVAFNPTTFLIAEIGVPDLIGFAFILGAIWILISRPMNRSTLFWALLTGSLSLLTKKNFLFDLVIVFGVYLLAYVVTAFIDRQAATRMKALSRELFSLRVILAAVGVVVGIAVLTPGTLSAIFSRDNSLFYASYQSTLSDVLATDLKYAGGVIALAAAIVGLIALVMLIRSPRPGVRSRAIFVLGFVAVSEFVWAFTQRQAGLIHEVHVWPLLTSTGFVGVCVFFTRGRTRPVHIASAAVVLLTFIYMFAPVTPLLAPARAAGAALPPALRPTVSFPWVQSNIQQLEVLAKTVDSAAKTGGPILVPVGSNVLNSSILSEVFAQRLATAAPDIFLMPQVDLQDALPWSTLIGDQGRTVLVSTRWTPDLAKGRNNLMNVDRFLQSPDAARWITSRTPVDAGQSWTLTDLQLVRLRIPQSDAIDFARAIRPYLPATTGHGIEDQLALLTDDDRRSQGPNSSTPTSWSTLVGGGTAPTRVLVNPATTTKVDLGTQPGCGRLQYSWTDISAPAAARAAGDGSIGSALKRGGTVTVPSGAEPWSFVLSLSYSDPGLSGCVVQLTP